jgi:hypothetical protein
VKLTCLDIGPGQEPDSFNVKRGDGIAIPLRHLLVQAGSLPRTIGICEIVHLQPDVIRPANLVQDVLGELGGDLVPHILSSVRVDAWSSRCGPRAGRGTR